MSRGSSELQILLTNLTKVIVNAATSLHVVGVSNLPPTSTENLWLSVFPAASRFVLPRECDVYAPGDASDVVHYIERGAVVEIRTDHVGTSHAVGLSGRGSLVGARLAASNNYNTSVRATTITDTMVRVMQRSAFLHATLRDPELARAYMTQLARRLEVARHLSDVCSNPNAGEHILGVLHTIADVFGVDTDDGSSIPVPSSLLERMTGTPQRIVDATLRELRSHGIVELERDAIRWVM